MTKNKHASALGKLAAGIPKKYSMAELHRRTQRLIDARAAKKKAVRKNVAKNRASFEQ